MAVIRIVGQTEFTFLLRAGLDRWGEIRKAIAVIVKDYGVRDIAKSQAVCVKRRAQGKIAKIGRVRFEPADLEVCALLHRKPPDEYLSPVAGLRPLFEVLLEFDALSLGKRGEAARLAAQAGAVHLMRGEVGSDRFQAAGLGNAMEFGEE